MNPKRKVLLSGPYGGLNIGDDAIAEAIIDQLEKLDTEITLASIDPTQSEAIFPQVSTHIRRLNLRGLKLDTVIAIRKTDWIIIGGGQQLEEPRLKNPIWGHLATTCQQVLLAKIMGKKSCIWGIGAPTHFSWIGKALARMCLKNTNIISTRDKKTHALLTCTLKRDDIILGADPVLTMICYEKSKSLDWLKGSHNIDPDKSIILIIPANDKTSTTGYYDAINEFVDKNSDKYQFIYFCTDLQPNYDQVIRKEKRLLINSNASWFDTEYNTTKTLAGLCSASDLVISARMHGLIFSLTQNTPCISISRSNKMDEFCEESGTYSIKANTLTYIDLENAVEKTFSSNDFLQRNAKYLKKADIRNNTQINMVTSNLARNK